jgi:hypothetical protein
LKKSIASRGLPERLRIAIFPDKICIGRIVNDRQVYSSDRRTAAADDTGAAVPWRPALAALSGLLADHAGAHSRAVVTLSNHFVRYVVVPWRDCIADDAERIALAAQCFRNAYGDLAAHWAIEVSDAGFRRNALASAIDPELPAELRRVLEPHDVSLCAVQPMFMSACDRFSKALRGCRTGCLALLEPRRVVFGIYDHAGWQVIAARRVAALRTRALMPVLVQELHAANLTELPENLLVAAVGSHTCAMLRSKTRAWQFEGPANPWARRESIARRPPGEGR